MKGEHEIRYYVNNILFAEQAYRHVADETTVLVEGPQHENLFSLGLPERLCDPFEKDRQARSEIPTGYQQVTHKLSTCALKWSDNTSLLLAPRKCIDAFPQGPGQVLAKEQSPARPRQRPSGLCR